jgi:hypothetical protein
MMGTGERPMALAIPLSRNKVSASLPVVDTPLLLPFRLEPTVEEGIQLS